MGFPVETVDGEIVQIVSKTGDGLLIAEDGSILKPTKSEPLKAEILEAKQAVEEAVEEVLDVVEAVRDVVEDMLDSEGAGDGEEAEAEEA